MEEGGRGGVSRLYRSDAGMSEKEPTKERCKDGIDETGNKQGGGCAIRERVSYEHERPHEEVSKVPKGERAIVDAANFTFFGGPVHQCKGKIERR